MKTPLELAAIVQASEPRTEISYMTLGLAEGEAAMFMVRPRPDATTGQAPALGYDTVFIDPVSGHITGQRNGRSFALSQRNLMPWLRHLHESLLAPSFWGTNRWGYWLMGAIALLWVADSFVALLLTFPVQLRKRAPRLSEAVGSWWRRWMPSWRVRWAASAYKLNFDLHRAGGLWVWAIIVIVAFTSFSLNLYREVFYPVMSTLSTTTPGPYETLKPAPHGTLIVPKVTFAEAIAIAQDEARRLGFAQPAGGIWWGGDFPFYNISFFDPHDETGAMGMGLSNIYVSSDDGTVLGTYRPWHGTAADIFVQPQLPLHSGRILGTPGRVLMSFVGVLVAVLSVTGIVIWWRKRKARKMANTAAN